MSAMQTLVAISPDHFAASVYAEVCQDDEDMIPVTSLLSRWKSRKRR